MALYNRIQGSSESGVMHQSLEILLRGVGYIKTHQRRFVMGGIVLILVVGVLIAWIYHLKSLNHQALVLYSQAFQEKDATRSLSLYKDLVAEYPNSPSAPLARMALAKRAFQEKEYDQVISWLEPVTRVDDSKAFLRLLALHNIATAYEAKGEWPKVIEYYQKAVVDTKNETREFSRYHLARAYEHAGQLEKARQFYKEIQDESQDVRLKELVARRLIWLSQSNQEK
ncbi:MAG: hypothetical protein A3I75_03020 [Deltaproteobacteria bacterium RIFCSPLOWO2_02_FULL_50_16]|nr:MAG: hypothetical protein A2053_04955 [Deltaproteobacteria bacterium GWA2_50_8]OGQ26447.1 MAG: hypothetical protein A3B79_02055 [Deltaproteobacteria bacterium RIFCSPHIGHO2_02_FULL_50_15]OGQ56918.1 MAG: hypothetical protein A3I75_03020 [Deltaproteobacteria bacterium RIFCSPLOWO2_02_FULL_50_16]OGQ67904.1 MAG: hypothetical protein A3F89_03220 [Deltaproteobacteria bacterium RIFCSPLOWO2_12_FULL_50_11]